MSLDPLLLSVISVIRWSLIYFNICLTYLEWFLVTSCLVGLPKPSDFRDSFLWELLDEGSISEELGKELLLPLKG